MTIAIFGKNIEKEFLPYLDELIVRLKLHKIFLICEKHFGRFLQEKFNYRQDFDGYFDKDDFWIRTPQMLLSIGGDGTFLDAVVYVKGTDIPVLGVNTGRLGFLANIPVNEIKYAMDEIAEGKYETEKREILNLEVDGKVMPGFDFALNEISVLKTATSSLLKIHAYIGEVYLTTYWADGLIVATPTGSTAYSLSGGGPIVSPECQNIILTPVCPHNLSMRPLVVPNQAVIYLQVEGRAGEFVLSMDSRMKKMEDLHQLKISTSHTKIVVAKLRGHNYYETLRNKLMWGEDKRNEIRRPE